ncbi:MAG TPA: DUF4340 domain-containing protein, partial [Woeseiaceae bacterium]|nr:DUF4340 domain-containing protein [Woeseiaceae bacterium]
ATLKWLALATVTLLIVLIAVERTDRSDTVAGGEYLIPGLKERINDITAIAVTGTGDTGSVNIARDGDGWQVREKDGFPADVGKLREILLALADARKLEQKTANPERFAQLGLAGPEAGGGVLIEISGDEFRHGIIVGNAAQSKYRYVRMAEDNQSWLIDQNPDLPADAAGWLASGLLDIESARVRSVSIHHEDGETIRLEKASAEDTNYTVLDIPEGRELSYATVANGIAGVLKGLTLEDARRSSAGDLDATSVFTTFDGLEITARLYQDGDNAWIALTAGTVAPVISPAETPAAAEATGEETAGEQQDAGEVAIDDTTDAAADDAADAADAPSTEEEANSINARHAGWQYRIPDYKSNLLGRRWADILQAED